MTGDSRRRARPLPGLCPVCSIATGPSVGSSSRLCYCCRVLVDQLRLPLAPVLSTATFRVGDRLHRLLRGYKDAPAAEVRKQCTLELADMLASVLCAGSAGSCECFGPWDLATGVPSSTRPGTPFDAVAAHVAALGPRWVPMLGRGPARLGHLMADRHGYALTGGAIPTSGRRILLIDDSYVTGARAQSAAAALRLAGDRVTGVLVLGRRE